MSVELGEAIHGDAYRLPCGHCGENIEVWEYAEALIQGRVDTIECGSCDGTMRVDEASAVLDLRCFVVPRLGELAPS